MRRGPVLRWLWLAALAFSSGAFARTEAPLTYRAIRGMLPAVVGLRLLGPEAGADIVGIDFLDLGPNPRRLPSGVELFLYAQPVPLGPTYCTQRRYSRLLTSAMSRDIRPMRLGEPLRILPGWDELMLARAPGCRLAAGQLFASNRDASVAMWALDALASAQDAARASGPMPPLQLTCRDEVPDDPDRCLGGGREVLAHLPLERACGVDRIDDVSQVVEVTICTGGPVWMLRVDPLGLAPSRLSMLWKYSGGGY